MSIKTIFILESSWDYENPVENSSVVPFVTEFGRQRSVNIYYQFFTDTKSFCHWINEFDKTKKPNALLYIAAHGKKGSLSGLTSSINRKTILYELKKLRNIKYVHFGSCLFGNKSNLLRLVKISKHLQWVAGYNEEIDWLNSTLFDLLLWNRLVLREDNDKGKLTHTIVSDLAEKHSGGLTNELGFVFAYKYRGEPKCIEM